MQQLTASACRVTCVCHELHKSPLQFRFLACSSKNGLKVVALWLNALLSSIHRDLVLEWHKLLSRLGVDWRHLPPWFATRSAQVVSLVKHFNRLRVLESDFVQGYGWQGFDVVRLYTNIPQDDLIQSLSALLGELVWDKHSSQRNGPRTRIYQVFKDNTYGAVWWDETDSYADVRAQYGEYTPGRRHGMKNDNWGVDDVKGDFYLFNFQAATDVLRLLVKFSYVQFGGMVWHQHTGIPMGINPAVFMANYYLFYYEYRFLAQFSLLLHTHPPVPGADMHASALFETATMPGTHPVWKSQWPAHVHGDFKGNIAWYVLNQFQLMVRFVDDLTSGPNMFLKHLLNRSNTILGGLIHGIYPDCLALERTDADMWSFPTLDVRVLSERSYIVDVEGHILDCCVVSNTVLYDKRREQCYDGIPIVQFTHVSSAVSAVVTTSIVYGQLCRFKELIMLRVYYVFECALLLKKLIACGYKRTVLLGKLKRHLKLCPDTFGDTTYHPLYNAILLRLSDPALNDHSSP